MDMRTDPRMQGAPEPSIGELIRSLLQDVTQLVRSEIKLAQAEIGQNAARAKSPVMLMAIGGLLLFGAFLSLLAALIGWLAPLVGAGTAAFIVAVVIGGAGVALMLAGRKQMKDVSLMPTRSVVSVKRDVQAFKGND